MRGACRWGWQRRSVQVDELADVAAPGRTPGTKDGDRGRLVHIVVRDGAARDDAASRATRLTGALRESIHGVREPRVGAVETRSGETGPTRCGVVHEDGDRVGVRVSGRESPGDITPVRAGDGRKERDQDVLVPVRAATETPGRTGRPRQREPHGVGLKSPWWQVERDPFDDPSRIEVAPEVGDDAGADVDGASMHLTETERTPAAIRADGHLRLSEWERVEVDRCRVYEC